MVFSSFVSIETSCANLAEMVSPSQTFFSLSFRTIVDLNIFSTSLIISNSVLTGILSFLDISTRPILEFFVRVKRLAKLLVFRQIRLGMVLLGPLFWAKKEVENILRKNPWGQT